jgi:hypothetical protein
LSYATLKYNLIESSFYEITMNGGRSKCRVQIGRKKKKKVVLGHPTVDIVSLK